MQKEDHGVLRVLLNLLRHLEVPIQSQRKLTGQLLFVCLCLAVQRGLIPQIRHLLMLCADESIPSESLRHLGLKLLQVLLGVRLLSNGLAFREQLSHLLNLQLQFDVLLVIYFIDNLHMRQLVLFADVVVAIWDLLCLGVQFLEGLHFVVELLHVEVGWYSMFSIRGLLASAVDKLLHCVV